MKNLESRQLRIGNLLLGRGAVSQVLEVYENHIKTEKENKIPMRIVQGVPLTEEWLLRFGFEKMDRNSKQGVLSTYQKKGNKFHVTNSGHVVYGFKHLHINYVHQLQNLIFALTGEELTLKK